MFYKQKLIALCRKSLTGLDLDLREFDDMPKADQANFLNGMNNAQKNDALKILLNNLEREQVMWIARDSKDETQKNFGRATINAIDYIKDKIEKYSALYQSKLSEGESFDPNKIV